MQDNETQQINNNEDKPKGLISEQLLGKLNIGRLLMLMLLTLVLCSFGLLSMFAAVPMTMAFLIFGFKKSIIISGSVSVLLFGFISVGQLSADWVYVASSFLFANFIALIISQMIIKNIHPARGLVIYGGAIIAIVFIIFGFIGMGLETSISEKVGEFITKSFDTLKSHDNYKVIISAGGPESRNLQDLIDNPEKVTTEILNWSVSTVFVSFFFVIWLNIFLVLRNSLLWKELHGYSFTKHDLTNFKLPVGAIFVLILSLVMILVGDYVFKDLGEIIGLNILYCLGIFYFFSGFGVYLDFLDSVNIRGFFRNVLIVITIFMAFKVIALIGVLDTWINFRKFLKKNENNEGDII